ncbi:hypothetical protein Anas_01142 [Armadillidium nasatum]|uniref:CUB domain-containing protein n=1 Tax=Armadillidium nasatum TaxID=96803 RepID=A0A5N5SXP2_9CRUS|nr:hypothetical protein Anas_01142 [Armadillidium nasatum]
MKVWERSGKSHIIFQYKRVILAEKEFVLVYNLEDKCFEEKAQIYIEPWKGAIVQVGYTFDYKNIPRSRSIHKCMVDVETKKGWSIVAAVEHMKIRGSKNANNKWECSDYIQFFTEGKGFVRKLISLLDLRILSSKSSEQLCGNKQLDGIRPLPIYDLSTDANSFHTSTNKMTMFFHQDNEDRHGTNNSFKVVFTTFKHASEQVFAAECSEKQKCYGTDVFCIDKEFICDGHVNCAFPGSATDERLCIVSNSRSNVFNLTSIIIITLISIVVTGLVICIISTIICKVKSRLSGNSRPMSAVFSNIPTSQPATAPNIEPEEPLPTYETVILEDSSADKTLASLREGELPPQYETLFPDGPPIMKDDSVKTPVR